MLKGLPYNPLTTFDCRPSRTNIPDRLATLLHLVLGSKGLTNLWQFVPGKSIIEQTAKQSKGRIPSIPAARPPCEQYESNQIQSNHSLQIKHNATVCVPDLHLVNSHIGHLEYERQFVGKHQG